MCLCKYSGVSVLSNRITYTLLGVRISWIEGSRYFLFFFNMAHFPGLYASYLIVCLSPPLESVYKFCLKSSMAFQYSQCQATVELTRLVHGGPKGFSGKAWKSQKGEERPRIHCQGGESCTGVRATRIAELQSQARNEEIHFLPAPFPVGSLPGGGGEKRGGVPARRPFTTHQTEVCQRFWCCCFRSG